jgi:hypothetical protein
MQQQAWRQQHVLMLWQLHISALPSGLQNCSDVICVPAIKSLVIVPVSIIEPGIAILALSCVLQIVPEQILPRVIVVVSIFAPVIAPSTTLIVSTLSKPIFLLLYHTLT